MTMRLDVEQNTAAGTDAFGHPVIPVWAAKATESGIVWTKARREILDGDKTALVEDIRALVPLGANVVETDRIANVKDRLGVVLFAGPLAIDTIQRRREHLELALRRIES